MISVTLVYKIKIVFLPTTSQYYFSKYFGPLNTICEFSTLIFAKKSNFSNLLKSLASEQLERSENFRI